jgi:gamma-glutamyl phosphate reductase
MLQTMKTPISDLHPFARFRREQRFMATPIGAFHVWLEDQHRDASALLASESLRMKSAAEAGSADWDKASERAELAAQVIREIEQSIHHIEAFREVMHERRNPSS